MSEARRNEIEEMDQWELLELVEQIRDIVWLTEEGQDAVKLIRDLVGVHEDVEADYVDDYDDPEEVDDGPEELNLEGEAFADDGDT